MLKTFQVGGAIVVCLVIAYMGFASYVMNAHPVSATKLDQIVEGMKSDEVQRLLGSPTQVNTSEQGSQFWVFSSPYIWCMVTVELSPKSRVVRVNHDH